MVEKPQLSKRQGTGNLEKLRTITSEEAMAPQLTDMQETWRRYGSLCLGIIITKSSTYNLKGEYSAEDTD